MQNRPAYAWNELAFSVLVKVSNWVSASCQPHSITSGHSNSLISKCTFQNSFHNFLKLKVPNQSIQEYKTFIHNYMNFCCFSLCKHVGGGRGGGAFFVCCCCGYCWSLCFPLFHHSYGYFYLNLRWLDPWPLVINRSLNKTLLCEKLSAISRSLNKTLVCQWLLAINRSLNKTLMNATIHEEKKKAYGKLRHHFWQPGVRCIWGFPASTSQCGQKGYCKHLIKSVECLAHNQFDDMFALLLYVLIVVNHVHFGE